MNYLEKLIKHIILFLFSILFISCSTTSKVGVGKNLINQNINYEAQINNFDAQLVHLDAMITAARLRKEISQTDPSNINNLMIENEVMGYESQKLDV
jgi:hypothetical protein